METNYIMVNVIFSLFFKNRIVFGLVYWDELKAGTLNGGTQKLISAFFAYLTPWKD